LNSSDFPSHECGVFAVYGHPDAALLTYYGLFALQHRGQESAGMIVHDGSKLPFKILKGMGLVSNVFQDQSFQHLQGTQAIGHVRYSTAGLSNLLNAQPLSAETSRGQLAIAHNGNLINADRLRAELEMKGSIFQATSDSEIILHLLAQPSNLPHEPSPLAALRRLEGAFSVVIMGEKEILGMRDPCGFRPLSLGKLGDAWILSSETCAFDLVGATFIRDVEPGEVVIIDKSGIRSEFPFASHKEAFCIFEYVYFARPDSNLLHKNVSQVRMRMGQELARLHPVEADIVVPIPDSGIYAALGFAEELHIPYDPAFVRNHYVGRTFIQPTQLVRNFNVRVKLNLIGEAVQGKRVVVIDDSIVRGTTARNRLINLREAGAKEVHLRISCPPHRHACYYGIDFPDPDKLIANQLTQEELCDYLGADSIGYLDVAGMARATELPEQSFCLACFTGDYPLPVDVALEKSMMERYREESQFLPDETIQPPLFPRAIAT
jgi:amidophosphoribosyltransferase